MGDGLVSETKKPVQLKLRLPPELHRQLVDEARQAGVSLNSFLVNRLTEQLATDHLRQVIREELAVTRYRDPTPTPYASQNAENLYRFASWPIR
jgi:hypothetical protein